MTHVFVGDGVAWLDRIERCRHPVGRHGEVCGMPKHNHIHDVPDTTEAQDHHRQRTGEREVA